MGTVAVYSATSYLAYTKLDGNTEFFLIQHLIRVGLAFGVMMLFSVINYRWVARMSKIGLIVALGLLLMVQILGVATNGATRWLDLGFIGFQPSDLARVALVLYVGVLLTRKQEYIKSFGRAFVPVFFWVFGTVLFIGLEDLSTAAVLLMATTLMCFIGRVSILQLGGMGFIGVCLAGLMLLSSPGRAERVEAYLGMKIFSHTNEQTVFDDQAEGYQAKQAKIAFAMGGLVGVGPGKSGQRDFLPEPYNDFIFAIIAEEFGLIGAMAVLGLLGVLLFRGFMRIARRAPDPLGLFLAVGFTTIVVTNGLIHAAVSCGLMPVTGLALPFVSYGGTSMVTNGMMIGILLNISRQLGGKEK